MVVIVVALEDCTISVMKAPQNAPDNGVAAALLSVVRSPEPANALRPLVMTLMPSRNRPTPPRIAIVVDIRPAFWAARFMLLNRALPAGGESKPLHDCGGAHVQLSFWQLLAAPRMLRES